MPRADDYIEHDSELSSSLMTTSSLTTVSRNQRQHITHCRACLMIGLYWLQIDQGHSNSYRDIDGHVGQDDIEAGNSSLCKGHNHCIATS